MGYCSSLNNVVMGSERASQSCLHDVLQRFSRKQVFHARIGNFIPQYSVGGNYLSMAEMLASGKKLYTILFVCYSLECFPINRHIFPQEPGDPCGLSCGKNLVLILSYRDGDAHYIVQTVSRPFQLYRGNIHTWLVFILVRYPPRVHTVPM